MRECPQEQYIILFNILASMKQVQVLGTFVRGLEVPVEECFS